MINLAKVLKEVKEFIDQNNITSAPVIAKIEKVVLETPIEENNEIPSEEVPSEG